MRTWGRREQMAASATAVLLAALVATVVWWRSTPEDPVRERRYQATTACLLTDDKGLTGPAAKAAWNGMRRASDATLIKVQYLSITGPQTAANGLSYFNSLGVQKCATIVAVGDAPIAALSMGREQFPAIRYIVVGRAPAGAAVTKIDSSVPDTIESGVAAALS
jgi:hypothetical protein